MTITSQDEVQQLGIECCVCSVPLSRDNWQLCKQKVNHKICTSCNNARAKKWKAENKEKVKEQKRKWSLKNKDKNKVYASKVTPQKQRQYSIKGFFGLSWEEYTTLYLASNGKCGICSIKLSMSKEEGTHTAHIDHNHITGKVRGILCRSCNRGIGYLNDSSDRLFLAADYLLKHGN